MTIHYIKLCDFMCGVAYVRKDEKEWLLRAITIGINGLLIHEDLNYGGVSHQSEALNYLQEGATS